MGSTNFIAMKVIFTLGLLLMVAGSVSAQKAYDAAYYHSKTGNRTLKLELGMGYFAASNIKRAIGSARPITFYPDTAVPDDQYQMTFHARAQPDYFILDDMQESYDTAPPVITGRYWSGKKWSAIKFVLGR